MVVEEPQVQPPDERASLCERFSLHQSEEWLQAICRTSVSHNWPSCTMRNAIVKWWNMLLSCMETTCNISFIHFSVRMHLLHLFLLTTNFCLLQMTVKAHMKLQNCKPCHLENGNSDWSKQCRLIVLITQIPSSTWHRSPHPGMQNLLFS